MAEHRDAVLDASRCDVAVAEREDALAAQMGLSPHDLPEDLYITDDALLAASCARRSAEDLVMARRRALDAAVVDYAMTTEGRPVVLSWAQAATDAGDARKAAKWMHLLNQADDTVALRTQTRFAARDGHAAMPVRAHDRPRHLALVV
jgi:hypothetical protein